MQNEVHIGAQGWNYDDWLGPFYPTGSRPAEYLDLYAKVFDTVEIDSTWYAIPAAAVVEGWRKRAPNGFTYSLKLPQEITHRHRLRDSAEILERFCTRARELGATLALILIQMPPDFSPLAFDALAQFLPLLPRDLRFAIEFRDRHWLNKTNGERALPLLRDNGVALALVDSPWIPRELTFKLIERLERWAIPEFAYVRWVGPRELTDFSRVQLARERELLAWAAAFAQLQAYTGQIFGYFNNHYQGHSPASCQQFKRLLGLPVVDPAELIVQPSLF
ncbi:MAG: DUF72 domain-containing protein [Acidobacteria bacterium]|nr:DUF72 domain-containing protein [Acidobacteriota bacterium]MBI3423996.1 DUF72 domain-containing protein [Acidobacteriota bacterium]